MFLYATNSPVHVLALASAIPSVWSEAWSWEPAIVLPLAALIIVYILGAIRRSGLSTLRWRHTSFFAGWASLFFALTSPIHGLSEQLFSAHMLQHEILILVSAPLISAAHPAATCLWAFAPRQRTGIGSWVHRIERSSGPQFVTGPAVAWLLEGGALWVWHIPYLYQATLHSDWVHAAQHLSFFVTAVIFWSALFGAGKSALGYGAATVYVFGTAAHCSALGALLTFSSVIWYPVYSDTTARWGLTVLQDQQLGGVIMWVPSGFVFTAIGLALFAKWLKESDRRLKLGCLDLALQKPRR